MIFIGDVALPHAGCATGTWPSFNQPLVANLEGPIVADTAAHLQRKVIVNPPEVVEHLRAWNTVAVSLANNHMFDAGPDLELTFSTLNASKIAYTGAGSTLERANRPALVEAEGRRWRFLSFGWRTIGCRLATERHAGVNPLQAEYALESTRRAKQDDPDALVIALVHWNYELEMWPQPADRRLGRMLIDAGADAVIGSHPHVVQGVESYRGAPILYSLGNWVLAERVYFNGRLRYPVQTRLRLAFEWHPDRDWRCRWFVASEGGVELTELCQEPVEKSPTMQQLTPYRDMGDDAYEAWFRRNRRTRLGLPVYTDPLSGAARARKDRWVALRQVAVDALFDLGVRKPRR